MGYCVRLSGQKFRLPAAKVEDCLNGILNNTDKWQAAAVKDAVKHIKYFDHIPANLKLIELVNQIWGLKFVPNKDNDIDKVEWEWEEMGDFDGFCNAVAAFIDPGYLEFSGEDSRKWRYVFRDGSWKNVKPVVTWPE